MEKEERKPFFGDYVVEEILGKGTFGAVAYIYKELDDGTRKYYVGKRAQFRRSAVSISVNTFLREVIILEHLKQTDACKRGILCPASYELIAQKNGSVVYGLILFELRGKALNTFIEEKSGAPPPESERRMLYERLEIVIGALHENGVAHLDMKPANIIVANADVVPYIIDVGLSCVDEKHTTSITTLWSSSVNPKIRSDLNIIIATAEVGMGPPGASRKSYLRQVRDRISAFSTAWVFRACTDQPGTPLYYNSNLVDLLVAQRMDKFSIGKARDNYALAIMGAELMQWELLFDSPGFQGLGRSKNPLVEFYIVRIFVDSYLQLPTADRQLIASMKQNLYYDQLVSIEQAADLTKLISTVIHADDDAVLQLAAQHKQLDVVKFLLERGANIHAEGDAAVGWAAAYGQMEMVKYLVEERQGEKANIRAGNDEALQFAAYASHLDVVNYLLERGADPENVDLDRVKNEEIKSILKQSCKEQARKHPRLRGQLQDGEREPIQSHVDMRKVGAGHGVAAELFAFDVYLHGVFGEIVSDVIPSIDAIFDGITDSETGKPLPYLGSFLLWRTRISALELIVAIEGDQQLPNLIKFVSLLIEQNSTIIDGTTDDLVRLTRLSFAEEYVHIAGSIVPRLPSSVDYHGMLFAAARRGKLETVRYLIDTQRIGARARGDFALREAAENGRLGVVKYLVEHGADIHVLNDYPLQWAAMKGHLTVVIYLVEQGADIHAKNDSALSEASLEDHLEIVKYLVKQGADIHANNDNALVSAAVNDNLEVLKYLVEQGANIHAQSNSALRGAAQEGYLEIVKYLVDHEANIHSNGEHALLTAAQNGHLEVVKYLIEHGAVIDVRYEAPFMSIVTNGHLEIMKIWVEHGFDVHIHNDKALQLAASKGHLEIVKYLVEHRANVRAERDGALLTAAAQGHLEVVKYLVDHGANVHARYGTILQKAAEGGHLQVVKYLVERGSDPRGVVLHLVRNRQVVEFLKNPPKKPSKRGWFFGRPLLGAGRELPASVQEDDLLPSAEDPYGVAYVALVRNRPNLAARTFRPSKMKTAAISFAFIDDVLSDAQLTWTIPPRRASATGPEIGRLEKDISTTTSTFSGSFIQLYGFNPSSGTAQFSPLYEANNPGRSKEHRTVAKFYYDIYRSIQRAGDLAIASVSKKDATQLGFDTRAKDEILVRSAFTNEVRTIRQTVRKLDVYLRKLFPKASGASQDRDATTYSLPSARTEDAAMNKNSWITSDDDDDEEWEAAPIQTSSPLIIPSQAISQAHQQGQSAVGLRVSFQYEADLAGGHDHEYASEFSPTLHMFLTHELGVLSTSGADDGVVVVPTSSLEALSESNDKNAVITVDIPFNPAGAEQRKLHELALWALPGAQSAKSHVLPDSQGRWKLPADASLAINAYAETATQNGQPCRTRAGETFFLMSELFKVASGTKPAHDVKGEWQTTGSQPLVKGFVNVTHVELVSHIDATTRVKVDPAKYVVFEGMKENPAAVFHVDDHDQEAAQLASDTAKHLSKVVSSSLDVFFSDNNDAPLSRANPEYLTRVHCPYFRTSAGLIPGAAYSLRLPKDPPPPHFYEKMLEITLARNDADAGDLLLAAEAQEKSPDTLLPSTRFVTKVFAEILTVYANAMVYLDDFTNTSGKTYTAVVDKTSDNTSPDSPSRSGGYRMHLERNKQHADMWGHKINPVAISEDFKIAREMHGDDCEGVAKEIYIQFWQFRRADFNALASKSNTTKLLVHMQSFARQNVFTPELVLAGVTNKKLEEGVRDMSVKDVLAHTYGGLPPTAKVMDELKDASSDTGSKFHGAAEAVRATTYAKTYEEHRKPYHAQLDTFVQEGTARSSAFVLPTSTYYAQDPEHVQKEATLRAVTRIKAQMALMGDLPAHVMQLEIPNRHVGDPGNKIMTDHADASDFYKGNSAVYMSAFRESGYLDFAFAQTTGNGSEMTHGVHFNKFAKPGQNETLKMVPYNKISKETGGICDSVLAQLEPIPALRRDETAAAEVEQAPPPAELQALTALFGEWEENPATAVLREDPTRMPLPPQTIVLSIRNEELSATVAKQITSAVEKHKEHFTGARIRTHYLADCPVRGDESSLPPVIIHDIALRLA